MAQEGVNFSGQRRHARMWLTIAVELLYLFLGARLRPVDIHLGVEAIV